MKLTIRSLLTLIFTASSFNASAITYPTLPQATVDLTLPVQINIISVPAGDSAGLQKAINQSQPGDVIELESGSTYTGSFTFPAKTGVVTLRSTAFVLLPQGKRVGPADVQNMAKIVTPGSNKAALIFSRGSSNWRIIGIEITAINIQTYALNTLVLIDSAGSSIVSDQPNNIILDRCYIHAQPLVGIQRCVTGNGTNIGIVDSDLSECHGKGYDSQAFGVWNGAGPFKLLNNKLEGAGENIMSGGADPTIQDLIPSDWEITGNYIYTPPEWGAGMSVKPWTKKNLLECKNARRMLIEGNIFDGSWADGQVGNALVIKTSNQSGKCTWCQTTDVTIKNNLIKNIGGGGGVSGTSGSNNNPIGGLTSRVLFENNLFENINVAPYIGVARLAELYNNAQDVAYKNNTFNTKGYIQHFISGGCGISAPCYNGQSLTNFEYTNNIAPFGQYGIVPGYSESELQKVVNGTFDLSGNVIYGKKGTPANYPSMTFVADYNSSVQTGKGANQAFLMTLLENVESGDTRNQVPPPPPPPQDTTAPTVTIESPIAGTVAGIVTISGTASDDVKVVLIDVVIDGISVITFVTDSFSYDWNADLEVPGLHTIEVTATDLAGNSGNHSVTVEILVPPPPPDLTPPILSIVEPASGITVSGSVTISGTAFDETQLQTVEVNIDGAGPVLATGLDFWEFLLDSKNFVNGAHTITAVATDTNGNIATVSIDLDIQNIILPPPVRDVREVDFKEDGTATWKRIP